MREGRPAPTTLWIVPTPFAREWAEQVCARSDPEAMGPRVWTWDELWAEVRSRRGRGPGLLSPAGARAALAQAIARSRRDGALRSLGTLAETSGYRRVLAGRITDWTRAGRNPRGERPDGADAADWEVFGRYRGLLRKLDAEDREGFAVWASRALRESSASVLPRGGSVALLDPSAGGRAIRTALGAFQARAGAMLVILPWESDGGRGEAFADVASLRRSLLDEDFVETAHEIDPVERPGSLCGVGRGLFRDEPDPIDGEPIGLAVRGAPRGEGCALVLAREVRDRLSAGAEPEDIVVLFPRWDEAADIARDTLRAWGIPAAGGPGRPLATDPGVAALLAAMAIPTERWESARLVNLLRNGRVRPRWPEVDGPTALATAAAAVRDTRVFRGQDAIRDALRRAGHVEPEEADRRRRREAERARAALAIFERLSALFDAVRPMSSWRESVDAARLLVEELNLTSGGDSADVERLFLALEDQAMVFDGLGRAREVWHWDDFTREVASLARELPPEPEPIPPGRVRLATVAEAEGGVARHVLLAGLEEGTFPSRDVLDIDPGLASATDDEEGSRPADRALAREMRRFLGVVGMAGESLTLIHPTTDEKGQTLLSAGFLDDVRRLFPAAAWDSLSDAMRRLDPILPESMAVAPAEARVRAVGLACANADPAVLATLRSLASDSAHRQSLLGAATALRLGHLRMHRRRFGPFDGGLADPRAAARIAADFGPGKTAFSASQLETLAFCPFKFFLKHILRLEPTDDREELEEDFTARGQLIHAALENLHLRLRYPDEPEEVGLPELVEAQIDGEIDYQLSTQFEPVSDVDRGLRAIEAERLRRTGKRYVHQFKSYYSKLPVECRDFEVQFGKEDSTYPGLFLGGEEDRVGLQGMIDRIDVASVEGRTLFRVIDYKTGACPTKSDVESGIALQLPLYAAAVQRVILADEAAEPLDVAYWELRKGGFKPVKVMAKATPQGLKPGEDWPEFLRRMEAFVLALVGRLRAADFPVRPCKDDCTRSCEYRSVCRIGQVRAAKKEWPEAPRMEPAG